MNPKIVTQSHATRLGYHRLTYPYRVNEWRWLDRTIADMQRGRIDFVLVRERDSADVEVWRKYRKIS